ncbi:MAG TPA: VanZ family protein, partial [Arenicellales bacterium]|nr:VanZ family protein [Arenicellales bacterium]
ALFRPGPAGYAAQARWLALGLAVLYGISDEWHQSFVPGREPDVLDVLADGVGAAVGILLLHMLVRGLSRR